MTIDSTPLGADTITSAAIARMLNVNIHTVRTWFRTGQIPGTKIGRHGWTTTPTAYDTFLRAHPDVASYDLTAADIAEELGVSATHTVRRWFKEEGLPGTCVRGVGERGATWRTTRAEFETWYAAYLTRTRGVVEETPGRSLTVTIDDTLASTDPQDTP